MEPLSDTTETRVGNYTVIRTLEGDVLILEVVSLIDRQSYSTVYRNENLSPEFKVLFSSVNAMSEVIGLCCQSNTA